MQQQYSVRQEKCLNNNNIVVADDAPIQHTHHIIRQTKSFSITHKKVLLSTLSSKVAKNVFNYLSKQSYILKK